MIYSIKYLNLYKIDTVVVVIVIIIIVVVVGGGGGDVSVCY